MYGVLDVGTTRVKIFVFDGELRQVYSEVHPNPPAADGTHDPAKLAALVRRFVGVARERGARRLGVATYRASVLAWRRDGTPVTPIYTWLYGDISDVRRGVHRFLSRLPVVGIAFREYSPLFRFLKAARAAGPCLRRGDCLLWTVDSYVAYLLTGRYVSDATNAAMTALISPSNFKPLPTARGIPLPEIVDNAAPLGEVEGGMELSALIADQQAAAVGDGALRPGVVKVTAGTGLFVDMPGGRGGGGLIPLVLLKAGGTVVWGAEAYLPTAGVMLDRLVEWGMATYEEAAAAPMEGRFVAVLPALAGLQFPPAHWARGAVLGLDLATSKADLLSSLVASYAFYVRFVLEAAGYRPEVVRVNGGMARLDPLLSCLAAAVGAPVERHADVEATARGVAALLAFLDGRMGLGEAPGPYRRFEGGPLYCRENYAAWRRAVKSLGSLRPFFRAG